MFFFNSRIYLLILRGIYKSNDVHMIIWVLVPEHYGNNQNPMVYQAEIDIGINLWQFSICMKNPSCLCIRPGLIIILDYQRASPMTRLIM